MWGALSDKKTNLSFTMVKITNKCLQFYMSAFCIVSYQASGSLWIPTIYNFHVTIVYMYVQYTYIRVQASISLGLAQQIMP
jgi:hypothetical protein